MHQTLSDGRQDGLKIQTGRYLECDVFENNW
jgi:hypothetical protein